MADLGDLSIIIPAYNAGHCIERALCSLKAAGASGAREIILVDDGSHDDTAERAERAVAWLPRLRIVRQANKGPGGARNTGLAHAQGRYVHYVDADDTLVANAYRQLEPVLADDPALIEFDYWREKGDGKFRYKTSIPAHAIENGVAGEAAVIDSGLVWSKLIRRDVAERAPFPESRVFEDDPVMGMLPFLATPVVKVNAALYEYRYEARSITRAFTPQQLLDREAMAQAYMANGRALGLHERFPEAFEFRCFRMFASALWLALLRSNLPDRHARAHAHGAKVRERFPDIERNRYFLRQSLRKRLAARLLMSSSQPRFVRLPELLYTRRLRLS